MCEGLVSSDGVRVEKASLPEKSQRLQTVAAIKAHNSAVFVPRRIVKKRPAAKCCVRNKPKPIKRHAFNLKRKHDVMRRRIVCKRPLVRVD